MQIQLAVGNVDGLAAGTYQYQVSTHALEQLGKDDVRIALCADAIDEQPWIREAAVVVILAADFPAMKTHFHSQPPVGLRGGRYIYIETGAIAQNVMLQATALGIGSVLVGGIDEIEIQENLGLPAHLQPTALVCLGHGVD